MEIEKKDQKITIKNGTLLVEKEFPFDVWETLQVGKKLLVLLDTLGRRDIPKETKNRNIFCLNERGDILWQIQDPVETFSIKKPDDNPFVGINVFEGRRLVATTWKGFYYDVDLETGKLSNCGYTK